MDNGSSANSLDVDQSNVMMMEDLPDTPVQYVVHGDIVLTGDVCDDVGLVFNKKSGKQADSASGHLSIMSTQQPRRASAVGEKVCAAPKKVKLKSRQPK